MAVLLMADLGGRGDDLLLPAILAAAALVRPFQFLQDRAGERCQRVVSARARMLDEGSTPAPRLSWRGRLVRILMWAPWLASLVNLVVTG